MSAARKRGHRWTPIEDLPSGWRQWHSTETQALLDQWLLKRHELESTQEGQALVAEFIARLVRSWSIETGILERIYTLDEGVTRTLVEQGFDAAMIGHDDSDLPAGRLLTILDDHKEAAEGLFAFVSRKRVLTSSYVKELHQVLLRHQDAAEAIDSQGNCVMVSVVKGDWKTLPNDPADVGTGRAVHEYCPPVHVAQEMERLLEMHSQHMGAGVPFDIEAAWLHHRFTQIHPFQDGNGRVARALATLVFLRAGSLPLIVSRDNRVAYIQALEKADDGNLRPLVELFRDLQRLHILRVLQLPLRSQGSMSGVSSIIEEARWRLASQSGLPEDLHGYAQAIGNRVHSRFESLKRDFDQSGLPVHSKVEASGRISEVVAVARTLGYEVDVSRPAIHSVLKIRRVDLAASAGNTAEMAVSVHFVVRNPVIAVNAFFVLLGPDSTDRPVAARIACKRPFLMTLAQSYAEVGVEFESWLEQTVEQLVREWRDSI